MNREYIILEDDRLYVLVDKVCKLLDESWQLQGGVCHTAGYWIGMSAHSEKYTQAMYREY